PAAVVVGRPPAAVAPGLVVVPVAFVAFLSLQPALKSPTTATNASATALANDVRVRIIRVVSLGRVALKSIRFEQGLADLDAADRADETSVARDRKPLNAARVQQEGC